MAQVWLVTGSSRGLGRAIVEAGLAAGHKVLATARDIESLHDLSERHGDQIKLFALDVTDESAAASAVKAAIGEEFDLVTVAQTLRAGRDRRVRGSERSEGGDRRLWLAGGCYQQRRIRQSLVRRRHADVGFSRTNRNESVRHNHRDESSSPIFSREEGWPLRSVFLDGREDRASGAWALFGCEMGC